MPNRDQSSRNQLLRNLVDQSNDGIFVIDPLYGTFLDVNEKACISLGYTRKELLGLSVPQIDTAIGDEVSFKAIVDHLKDVGQMIIQGSHIRKDGTNFPVEVSIKYIQQDQHEYLVSVARDVTERHESEETLKYRLSFENLITDISTEFINLPNDKTDEGISSALRVLCEFVNVDRSYICLFSEDGKYVTNTHEWCNEYLKPFSHELQSISVENFPWFVGQLKKFETIYIQDSAQMPDEACKEKAFLISKSIKSMIGVPMVYDQHLIGCIGFDSARKEMSWNRESITLLKIVAEIFTSTLMRKRIQGKLDAFHQRMFHAEQLASLGTVSATIAHELNQPFTGIQLFLQQALREVQKEDINIKRVAENISDSLTEIEKAATIVDRFRKFARKSSRVELDEVNLSLIAKRIAMVLGEHASKVRLKTKLDFPEELTFRGNAADFEQLFFVLIENAIHAADEKIQQEIVVSGKRVDGHIQLDVADTCGGLAEHDVAKMFQPFFTTKPAELGTGLGLSILDRIVTKYRGDIKVDNRVNEGVAFKITLPLRD
jgi:PAS domain S-box-containing protein